ncbi:MAG TPA: type II secretion system F family protein [Verrucomicrobiae bacterium]|jgi:pilus assembly protein TadC|nr:type II secretion system F family protein [Verrucomicrobiae bacterium]
MQLLIGMLFGLSGFMIFMYVGNSFSEKRMIARRVQSLQEGAAPAVVAKENLMDLNFSTKYQRSGGENIWNSPTFLMFAIAWLACGFIALQKLHFPIFNSGIILGVIPIIVVRVLRITMKRRRIDRMHRELPGALDLMVVCLEAGLALNSTLLRIANEMEASPLGRELRRAADEINAGIPMEDALRAMAKRIEIEDLNSVVSAIVQAQKMGSELALTFRVQSETLREKYKMHIKERIQKIPIKVLFPLVLFIFPALFVVILGPSMIQVMRTLQQLQ